MPKHRLSIFIPAVLMLYTPCVYASNILNGTTNTVTHDTAAKNTLDIEAGVAFTGYNNVAVPAEDANRFSLKDDLTADPVFAGRVRYGRQLGDKHWVGVLVAPLTLKPQGKFDKDINFKGDVFKAGEQIDATYRFNSYRLLYRYKFIDNQHSKFSFGGAIKMRDAEIRLKNNSNDTPRANIGFVPLLSFNYTYKATPKLDLMVDGEALIAPQGRAEDVFFGAQYHINDNVAIKGGYRVLEGGTDNDELYTFSLFNYATTGVVVSF